MTTTEKVRGARRGLVMVLILIAMVAFSIYCFIRAQEHESAVWGITGVVVMVLGVTGMPGLIVIMPNEAKVLLLFGAYRGTIKDEGWWWVNPFYTKTKISLRVRNFETDRLKVNDLDGNPIEVAAVVVWKVVDTVEALFEVDDFVNYVHVQSESALRNLATQYSYDTHEGNEISLRGSTDQVAERLQEEIQNRLAKAGVEVLEARITHLAYATEIAQAMLRRQQAGAIIAARQKIVEGAVGMVRLALNHLSEEGIVELDEERKATMVSNLLVVLCSEQATSPVINTGSLT